MGTTMFTWRALVVPRGVHRSAPSAVLMMPLRQNWMQTAILLGTLFLAAAAMTLASAWPWMGAAMSTWRATALPRGAHRFDRSAVATMPLPRNWIRVVT